MRKGKYYFVADGWGGQRGSFIEEVYLTKTEYQQATSGRQTILNGIPGFITKSYTSALYYVQD